MCSQGPPCFPSAHRASQSSWPPFLQTRPRVCHQRAVGREVESMSRSGGWGGVEKAPWVDSGVLC